MTKSPHPPVPDALRVVGVPVAVLHGSIHLVTAMRLRSWPDIIAAL
ncbi:hypothetical protein AB0I98_26965 [Streptomyces sp. NPDC050211]|jgi:hypothetical protein